MYGHMMQQRKRYLYGAGDAPKKQQEAKKKN
eukprot:CAMPEP_0168576140 /NCGR_PEP_ID=MMETSP0413-20121227/20076_1 /TAXON_ID=136452 /ORGANISM="Filamoeba nolandi, Strain NC-AS-23-1" /LENGTH=30 /DNA_ID= /DNA_START= /DNA_END= /DNA_ORIENTATION=